MNSEEEYATETAKKVIADVCNLLGYHGIRKTTMSVLVDLFQRCKYIFFELKKKIKFYNKLEKGA